MPTTLMNQDFQNIIFNTTAVWINILDKDANVIKWNKAAAEISGYTEAELIGKNDIWELLYPDEEYRSSVYLVARTILKTKTQVLDFESTITCKDGTEKTMSWNTHFIEEEDGTPIGSIAIARDITQIKLEKIKLEESQKSLKEINTTLEYRVEKEVKKRLEVEKRLLHKNRLASMGEMINNIAHQFRQPLMSINATLININRTCELGNLNDLYMKEKILEINNTTQFMSQTIESFRTFFRKDKSKSTINLANLLQKSVKLIEDALKDISIDLNVSSSVIIEGYPNELQQVFISILNNAHEALNKHNIPEKKLFINLKESKYTVEITIEDNAGGIKRFDINKIFEPYFSTKHKYGGTGLGLYICKVIVEEHMDGTIEVVNTNRGALFSIILIK